MVALMCGCSGGSAVRDDLGDDLLAAIAGPADDSRDRHAPGGVLDAILLGRDQRNLGESPGFRRYLEGRGLRPGSQGFCSRVVRQGRVEFVSESCR